MRTFHIQFYEKRKIFFTFSLVLIAIGVIFNVIFGAQLDIQFKGGAVIKYSYTGTIDQGKIENIVQDTIHKEASVRIHEDTDKGTNDVSISFAGTDSISIDQQKAVATALDKAYPNAKFSVVSSNSVNPTMGKTFFLKCLVAIAIAAVLLVLYVGIRFKKIGGMSAGVMAIVALLHDVLMIYFTFVVFRIPINDNFIAVVLTILGYSLNDTIIIYDRVRENRRIMGPKTTYAELVNTSINQTLTRSINTSLCTFVAIAIVFIVGMIYGLDSVTTFALPMMIGVLFGCYSTIFIAGPLYVVWQEHKLKKKLQAQD